MSVTVAAVSRLSTPSASKLQLMLTTRNDRPGCLVIFTPIITESSSAGLLSLGSLGARVLCAACYFLPTLVAPGTTPSTLKGELSGWFKHGSNVSSVAAFDKAAAAGNTGNGGSRTSLCQVERHQGAQGVRKHYEKTTRRLPQDYGGADSHQSNDGRICCMRGSSRRRTLPLLSETL